MASADYQAAVLDDTPAGYWILDDDGTGATAADASGNGNDATGTSITWEQAGPEDSGAVALDGSNSYLDIADSADWVFTDVTLEAWIYPAAIGAGGRMSIIRHQTAGSPYLFISLQNLVPEIGSFTDGVLLTRGSALTADTWYHFAAVRDRTAGTWTWYLNGAQLGTTTSASGGSNVDISGSLRIGAWAGGTSNRYAGRVAHAAYYTSALSAARIAAHYDAMVGAGPTTGTATGQGGGTAAATGIRIRNGAASGSGGGSAASTGIRVRLGVAAGNGGGTGAAVGDENPVGSATGHGGGVATAVGLRTRAGVATGVGGGLAAGFGVRIRPGTAAGDGGGVGVAIGHPVTEIIGTASGDGGGVGTAVGVIVQRPVADAYTVHVPPDPWVYAVEPDPWVHEVPPDPWTVLIGAP